MSESLPCYFTIQKYVGETPLEALERGRKDHHIPKHTPLSYAGRLDPMASGTLLILVGNECKVQTQYHSLDKAYTFEVLLGIASDTHDVLGLVTRGTPITPSSKDVHQVLRSLIGTITLPYPHFSSRTVQGKPLHVWTLEGRLGEIVIPEKTSRIYKLALEDMRTESAEQVYKTVSKNIETIPPVTDPRKALGEDFRREDVRRTWKAVYEAAPEAEYTILTVKAITSSGTYMRTLAHVISEQLGGTGLAYRIERTRIGRYCGIPGIGGFWPKIYR